MVLVLVLCCLCKFASWVLGSDQPCNPVSWVQKILNDIMNVALIMNEIWWWWWSEPVLLRASLAQSHPLSDVYVYILISSALSCWLTEMLLRGVSTIICIWVSLLLCSRDALDYLWASLTQAFLELTKRLQRRIYLNECEHILEINILNSHKSKCWCWVRRWKVNLQRFGSRNAMLNLCLYTECTVNPTVWGRSPSYMI